MASLNQNYLTFPPRIDREIGTVGECLHGVSSEVAWLVGMIYGGFDGKPPVNCRSDTGSGHAGWTFSKLNGLAHGVRAVTRQSQDFLQHMYACWPSECRCVACLCSDSAGLVRLTQNGWGLDLLWVRQRQHVEPYSSWSSGMTGRASR